MLHYGLITPSTIQKYVPEMRRLGVSKVARSPRGFLTWYRRAYSRPAGPKAHWWLRRRAAFIARHMAQARKNNERLWVKGKPSRRALALIAWAYLPRK